MGQVQAEANRLYALLQANVDHEIQQIGFVPEVIPAQNGNGHLPPKPEVWVCTANFSAANEVPRREEERA